MRTLEPEIAAQLKDFNETIVLPAFEDIRETFEPSGYQVWTTEEQTTGDDFFNELLHSLKRASGACFLANLDSIDSANALWQKPRYLTAALMVQLPEKLLVSQHPYENRFCLGVQCNVSVEKTISVQISVIYGKRDGTFEYFQAQLDLDEQNQAIAKFTQSHVQQRFSDVFAEFRTQALEKPQPKLEPIPEPAQAPKAIAVPDIPSPPPKPSVTQTAPNDPAQTKEAIVQTKEAIAQKEALQRAEVRQFLMRMNVRGALLLDDLHGRDLERLVAWSRAMQTVPVNTDDYHRAHSKLHSQAAHYALLLKGTDPMTFANLFELYCSVVHRICHSRTEPGMDAAQIFIEQVNLFAEPKPEPRGQHAVEYNGVCSTYRNIAQKFGKPEHMLHQWIGTNSIQICRSEPIDPESMIPKIQACSRERQVRFPELSWAVLQVYQNQDLLLTKESSPAQNAVESLLYSAWLTIQQPMGEVRYIKHQTDDIEFVFERSLFNSGRQRTVRARVIVSVAGGWVFLHSYGFEET